MLLEDEEEEALELSAFLCPLMLLEAARGGRGAQKSLCDGSGTWRAVWMAVARWSPVIISVRIPASSSMAIVFLDDCWRRIEEVVSRFISTDFKAV